jgi:hypothetical protein
MARFCRMEEDPMFANTDFELEPSRTRPDRTAVLLKTYQALYESIGLANGGTSGTPKWPEPMVAHPLLLRILQSDPSVCAILPTARVPIALGLAEHAPFLINHAGLLLLPPVLLGSSCALAAAVRWGLEAARLFTSGALPHARIGCALACTLHHAVALLSRLQDRERTLVLGLLPDWVAAALAARDELALTPGLLAWQASRVETLSADPDWLAGPVDPPVAELSLPMERILAAGGDSRLTVYSQTGLNRYGTVPRPRPEAVHFSSSTASSISDYGFTLCEMLRHDLLLAAIRDTVPPDKLRRQLTDGVTAQLLDLLAIDHSEADVTLAPSGSDTELLAVMLAAAAADVPLTNILIAPEETGRAVALAGAGRFFDDLAGSGACVRKGQEAWRGRSIEVKQVAIRADDGQSRAIAEIEVELRCIVTAVLARGGRILLHLLACSKTGLSAPSTEGVIELVALAPDRIDVVVDACQMRTPLDQIASWIRLGWMVQISGSKFFTGPPFSGALIFPPRYRERATGVGALLATAPGVGRPEDWNAWWRPRLRPATSPTLASFGFLFRWLPAIAEAHLLGRLPAQLCREVFDCFRASLVSRLARSRFLTSIAPPGAPESGSNDAEDGLGPTDLARRSIVCFTITVQGPDGEPRTLDTQECQRLFELLNFDLSHHLGPLGPADQITAAQCAHIGQPVTLCIGRDDREISILRMVIGARFFTIVGYAPSGATGAALVSEIADAIRAIDKVELLAERWAQITELTVTR